MKEYEIGEILVEDGVGLMCIPAILDSNPAFPCKACVFGGRGLKWCEQFACIGEERSDGVQVHFKAITDMDAKTLEITKALAEFKKGGAK